MSSLFSSPSPPKPQPAPEPIKNEDAAVQKAAGDALMRRRLAAGYRSTILSQMSDTSTLKTNLGS